MSSNLEGNAKDVKDVTVQRQCEWEYLDQIKEQGQASEIGPFQNIFMARSTKRNELMFFNSVRVPYSFCPLGRMDTLASQRNDPSCILPSQIPRY